MQDAAGSAATTSSEQGKPSSSRILERFCRALIFLISRTVYRLRVIGLANLPLQGGALLASNHLSLVDAVLLQAAVPRPIRFLIFREYYDHWLLRPLAQAMGAIPISSQMGAREMLTALRTASNAVAAGDLVCIFAEGEITRIGQTLSFRRGLERIMARASEPIIPVHLDGLWGSIFSLQPGHALWRRPQRLPFPVTVSFGAALPPQTSAAVVRQKVQELASDAFVYRKAAMLPLGRAFIRTARREGRAFFLADAQTEKVSFAGALIKMIFLARRLAPQWRGQRMVGILLPPSPAGALVNLAALVMGKVPINLNYTASAGALRSCIEQCELQTIISSRAFLERVPLDLPLAPLPLEDLAANPRLREKLTALLLARLAPVRLLERALGLRQRVRMDDLATVIFSSGSTGEPKGVMLSHFNIAANGEQLFQSFRLEENDRFMGILPFFHSFGFTVTLCLPAVYGLGVIFYPNPLDAKMIGELARTRRATILVGTPTFLQTYARRCEAGDFGSLRLVIAGAEKMPERIANLFEDRFGIRPLEGYGCTECSPVVAANTLPYRAAGYVQTGARRGTVGRPLPGISVKLVDPETRLPCPAGSSGLLLVRGPNVMQGYLKEPEKTAAVLQQGWYNTGDLATMDDDGFLTLSDRLSRFSKIGGEMVPHLKVEELLHSLSGPEGGSFVVTSIVDEQKGEKLVVLHTLGLGKLRQLQEQLAATDLPNLWRPRQFVFVESLPYLGSGKVDLRRAREVAQQHQLAHKK